MTLPAIPGSFRPGAPTSPQPVIPHHAEPYHLQFLTAEERATANLMTFFEQARLDLETFIRTGDLTVSDATFYRQLLDETNRVASSLNAQGAQWVSDTIPAAYSAAWRASSSVVVPRAALEALSRETLGLVTATTNGIRQAVRQTIAAGILQGLSGADVRARIIATGLTNIPHWPTVEYRAGVIARTETMRAFNQGAIDVSTANGARYFEWIASPDEATCPICLPRDGQVYSNPGVDDPTNAYPGAQPLPHLPAHPRCRCTVRARYRGPDGKVIRQGADPPEPELPKDAMGGKDAPTLPPAVGDFRKAAGGLANDLKLYLDGSAEGSARRSFWRSMGKLDDDMIREITGGSKSIAAGRMDAFMRLRYGITYIDKAGMTSHLRFVTIRALELIRSVDPRHVVDNPYLQRVGDKPYGAKKFGKNILARAFLTGHVEWNPSLSKQYEGQFLRMVDDGSFEVIVHEFMHSSHYQMGAYAGNAYGGAIRSRADGSPSFTPESAREMQGAWRDARHGSSGVSPSPGALTKLDEQIAKFEALISGSAGYDNARNRSVVAGMRAQRDRLKATLDGPADHEFYPTEYAKTGGELEDFAESGTMYLLDPARLKRYSPKRFEFMRTYVFPS